jgi:outer membrane protein
MKKAVCIILFSISVNFLFAQEQLSLQQAIEIGLKNNYSILIAKNDAQIANNNLSVGNAGMLPRADVNVSQNNSVTDTKQTYSSGSEVDRTGSTSNSLAASGVLSWTLFDGFKMFATYNKLQEFNAMGELAAKQTIENNVEQIISTYFDIVKQKALLNVVDDSRKVSQVKLNIAKTKFNIGITSKAEYLQAQVDMNADEASYKKQILAIETAKINLNRLLARNVSITYETTDSIEINYSPAFEEVSVKFNSSNTALQFAERNINAYKFMFREFQGERFPIFGVNGSYDYLKSKSQTGLVLENRSNGINYGFTLSYNLFNGFNTSRNISNAKLEWESAKVNYNLVKSSLSAELLVAYKSFTSNNEILQLQQNNSKLAKENVDIALERFRVGTINDLQLKEAQQSNVSAQTNLVSSLYDTKLAETTLKKLLGELMK